MSAEFLENRISSLAPSQLPDHVRHEYENFVFFAEAYYEYLEQKKLPQEIIQNITDYANIDDTIDEFINYFYKNYCADIPTNPEANKKLTLKKINELYNHKGSEKAVRLLFRLLFNNDVGFYYPEIQVLKASGGRWSQRLSIKVSGNWDSVKNLIGHKVTGLVSGATARVVNAEYQTGTGITELFLDRKTLNGTFVPYEDVSGNLPGQSNELFLGRIFNAFLGRDPTETELAAYLSDLVSLTSEPRDIIQEIAQSEECESYLVANLDFMKTLIITCTGDELTISDYVSNYGPRLTSGVSRSTITTEVLNLKSSVEYLRYVLRNNDSIIISANIRPIVSNVTVLDRGYNYNVGDIVTIDTDVKGNNGVLGTVTEISYFTKPNYDGNIANGNPIINGIVKIDLDNYDAVNVTYANANLILSRFDLSGVNVIRRGQWQNNMPALHSNIVSGNSSLSFGQRANLKAYIGAMCEYSGTWKRDKRSKVQEGVISLPETKFGGMVLRGRRDDGSLEDDLNRFISNVYFYLLNRTPSTVEYQNYKSVIKRGDIKNIGQLFSDVIVELADKAEFRDTKKYKDSTIFLETIYQICVGRYPESEGFKFWYGILRSNGFSREIKSDVVRQISSSEEALAYFRKTYNPEILITDDVYYQPFSYELQTSENINVWREIVKKLVHPAGLVFFGRTKISNPAAKIDDTPGKIEAKVRGIGSIRGIYNYLNVAIRVLKTLPTLAPVPVQYAIKEKRIFSSVTGANANISYIGSGPRYATIDRWKFSYSATVDGQDEMYAQVLANITLDRFDADNIRSKYDITPPLYTAISNLSPWTFSVVPSANEIAEGRVVTFNIITANVPDGISVLYLIERVTADETLVLEDNNSFLLENSSVLELESATSEIANNSPRTDIGYLLDGLTQQDPVANASHLLYQNPSINNGNYYINWSNNALINNAVLTYCDMNAGNVNSSANGWMLIDTTMLNVYDSAMGVGLRNMTRSGSQYNANSFDGIKIMSIPIPRKIRGIRVEYIELENIGFAGGTVNRLDLDTVYNASIGLSVTLGSGFDHFGVSVHSSNNMGNTYLSLSTIANLQNTFQGVKLFGNEGYAHKRGNANLVYFTQTDNVGFDIDRIVISQSDGLNKQINIRDMRIWVR